MIYVTDNIRIPENEIEEKFVRSSGPGGQNVNKVSTAVQIRFNIRTSPSVPEFVKGRMFKLYGSRISNEGFLTVSSDIHRTQLQNREEALERLIGLFRIAAVKPKVRRKTKATYSSGRRRLDSKRRNSDIKRGRRFSADSE